VTTLTSSGVGLDPADPAFRADPYSFYRALREQGPAVLLADTRAWAVSGYEQVRTLLRDPRLRPQPLAPAVEAPPSDHLVLRAHQDAERLLASFMHHRARADHARLRRLVTPAFSPSRVEARRARIQSLTDKRIEDGLSRGRLDVVRDLGWPLSMTVIAEVVGVPERLLPAASKWARELVYRLKAVPTAVEKERGRLAVVGLAGLVRELTSDGTPPGLADEGLLWALERARREGALSEEEVVAQCTVFLLVGHITTQHLVGNGVLALLRNPDQWELLRARPELIGTAVEELVRYDTPAPVLPCIASEDLEVAGETIRRGEAVLLLLSAAHRDPAVFADPDRLDITRSPNPHLGFGHGAHHCVGAALATLEARVAIGTLVRRVAAPRLETEALEWTDALPVRGLTSLPILMGD
jgi:pimeloyl-[acyl-carrier protein] synthase